MPTYPVQAGSLRVSLWLPAFGVVAWRDDDDDVCVCVWCGSWICKASGRRER